MERYMKHFRERTFSNTVIRNKDCSSSCDPDSSFFIQAILLDSAEYLFFQQNSKKSCLIHVGYQPNVQNQNCFQIKKKFKKEEQVLEEI